MSLPLFQPERAAPVPPPAPPALPTLAGLTPTELHDRFWAARGVQVVRPGERVELVEGAELFLLLGPRLLAIFRLRPLLDRLCWLKPEALWVRLSDRRERDYRELAVTDARGAFVRFDRLYGGADARLERVALTRNRRLAGLWNNAPSAHAGWRRLRHNVAPGLRSCARALARTFDRDDPAELVQFVRQLMRTWTRPDTTIPRLRLHQPGVWMDRDALAPAAVHFVGPAWVGVGRALPPRATVTGPAVLWDDPVARPWPTAVQWLDLEPTPSFTRPVRPRAHGFWHRPLKRLFDLAFASAVLLLVLPLFPAIMLAIYLEDGRPFFFAHRRQTRGGRDFPCLKFRSMGHDAARVKAQIARHNQADGPQFFIEHDPRVTRVGRILRKYQLDELPQFLNVLAGHMSVVGPRPSPHEENQFCPPWREARLSVRPGITGLWQIRRTRQAGADFQEWIRYDLEYVEKESFRLDLWIIWRTLRPLLGMR